MPWEITAVHKSRRREFGHNENHVVFEHHNNTCSVMEHIELKAGKWTVLVNAKALSNIAGDAPLFKACSECILVDLGLHLIEAGCAP